VAGLLWSIDARVTRGSLKRFSILASFCQNVATMIQLLVLQSIIATIGTSTARRIEGLEWQICVATALAVRSGPWRVTV
jgi:hypothetical protein